MDKNSDKILKLKQNLRALKPQDAPPQPALSSDRYTALKKPHPNKSNKAFYILHRLKPE